MELSGNTESIFEFVINISIVVIPALLALVLAAYASKSAVAQLRALWAEVRRPLVTALDEPSDLAVRVIALAIGRSPAHVARYSGRIVEAAQRIIDEALAAK